MELETQVQIIGEAVCANTFGKGMNLSLLHPAMEK